MYDFQDFWWLKTDIALIAEKNLYFLMRENKNPDKNLYF